MKPAIVMQTDFTKGVATCTMDGVIASIDPEIRTYDCTHTIAPFDIYGASCSLDFVVDFWPAGTIFVSVVDPGVGTSRRACCAKLSNGCFIITPDNGALTHVKNRVGIVEVRQIDETKNRLETTREVSIFHGRDLFAYCAGKFAAGLIDFEGVGPAYPVEEIVMLDLLQPYQKDGVVTGMITTSERGFGLVNSNIPYQMLEDLGVHHGDKVECAVLFEGKDIFREIVAYAPSFGFVPKGAPLVMISETKHVELAKNLRDIATEYDIGAGPGWTMELKKA